MNTHAHQTGSSRLVYTDVPGYFGCDNDRVNSLGGQKECFKCCRRLCTCLCMHDARDFCVQSSVRRHFWSSLTQACTRVFIGSACIVDEFANGARKAGYTYSYCDKSCYRYCGYFGGTARFAIEIVITAMPCAASVQ